MTLVTTTQSSIALLPASFWANYTGRCPPDAVNCYHTLQPWEAVSLAVSVLGITFHGLVFNFILRQALRGHAHFSSPFYKLYLILAVTEIVTSLQVLLVARAVTNGFLLDVYEGNDVLARMDYIFSDYFTYFQWFVHVLLAANRFTVFAMPMSYKKIWKAKTLAIATAVVAVLPLACIFFEIPAAAGFYYIGPNQLTDYFTDEKVIYYECLVMASTSLFTSLLSATLDIGGLIAFKRYAKTVQISEEHRKNLRLLFCSLLMLVSQSIMTCHTLVAFYGTLYDAPEAIHVAAVNGPWVYDQFRGLSPICLVITSKDVRREFLQFYRLRKRAVSAPNTQLVSPTGLSLQAF